VIPNVKYFLSGLIQKGTQISRYPFHSILIQATETTEKLQKPLLCIKPAQDAARAYIYRDTEDFPRGAHISVVLLPLQGVVMNIWTYSKLTGKTLDNIKKKE